MSTTYENVVKILGTSPWMCRVKLLFGNPTPSVTKRADKNEKHCDKICKNIIFILDLRDPYVVRKTNWQFFNVVSVLIY